MFAPRLRLAVTEQAADDLRSIQAYGLERWGVEQSIEYEIAIHTVLGMLCAYPELGATRDDLRPELRSHPVFGHIIFYLIDGDMLVVQRIVHQRMNIRRTLLP